jgi:hypothetical protein
VTWPEAATAIVGIVGGLATLAGGASKLAATWTKKGEAIGRRAAAEEQAAHQLAELRASFANFMSRVQAVEDRISRLEEGRPPRSRRPTLGLPGDEDT